MASKLPVTGIAVGGGLAALTQIGLKLAVKPDVTKKPSEQKLAIFLNRQAGAVAMGVTVLASAVTYFLTAKKSGWGQTVAVFASGTAASIPGIVLGLQASMAEKKKVEALKAANATEAQLDTFAVTEFSLATAQFRRPTNMGVVVAEPRQGAMGAPPMVDLVSFGAPSKIDLYGTHSASSGAAVNMAAFGGKAF